MGPGAGSVTIILATMFLWSVFAADLGRAGLSSAIVFVDAGFALTETFDVLHVPVDPELLRDFRLADEAASTPMPAIRRRPCSPTGDPTTPRPPASSSCR